MAPVDRTGAARPAARPAGEPLPEAQEVQASRGEDVAEVDLGPPAIARPPEAAAANAAGQCALNAGAGGGGRAARRGRLALARGLQRRELRLRTQAERAAGRAARGV